MKLGELHQVQPSTVRSIAGRWAQRDNTAQGQIKALITPLLPTKCSSSVLLYTSNIQDILDEPTPRKQRWQLDEWCGVTGRERGTSQGYFAVDHSPTSRWAHKDLGHGLVGDLYLVHQACCQQLIFEVLKTDFLHIRAAHVSHHGCQCQCYSQQHHLLSTQGISGRCWLIPSRLASLTLLALGLCPDSAYVEGDMYLTCGAKLKAANDQHTRRNGHALGPTYKDKSDISV